MSQFTDEEIERVLWVWGARIADLKKDARFKYVSVFKNQGVMAGEEWPHAHSEVTATIFVPRRIKYELHAAHDWFKDKERCIFCDVRQAGGKAGKADRGCAGRLLRAVPVCIARALRSLGDAPEAQSAV